MFAEWASLSPIIIANSNGAQSQSVLNKFSDPAGREVTIAVTKQLAANLGLTQPAEPSSLTNDDEVSVVSGNLLTSDILIKVVLIGVMVHGRHLSWAIVTPS